MVEKHHFLKSHGSTNELYKTAEINTIWQTTSWTPTFQTAYKLPTLYWSTTP